MGSVRCLDTHDFSIMMSDVGFFYSTGLAEAVYSRHVTESRVLPVIVHYFSDVLYTALIIED